MLVAERRITVPTEGLSGLHVTARPGVAVVGRAVFAQSGEHTPPPDNPRIGLRPISAGIWRAMPAWVGSDGTFSVLAERPGSYEVFAFIGPSPWAISRVTIAGRVVPDAVLTVADREITGLEVVFTTASPTLTGTVTNEQGQPDTTNVVIMFPVDGTAWRKGLINERRVRLVNVSSSGVYSSPLPAGEYYVAAVPVQFTHEWKAPDFLQRLSALATTVTLREGETRTLALKPVSPGGR